MIKGWREDKSQKIIRKAGLFGIYVFLSGNMWLAKPGYR